MNTHSLGLDIGKGMLVLVMLAHHAWSGVYRFGDDAVRGILSFVSSGFILFSGFLFGYYLLESYIAYPRRRAVRDFVRGFRLLGIYFLVNFLLYLVNYRGLGYKSTVDWFLLCLRPNPPEVIVFSLLNAFGYFFIAASVIFLLVVSAAKLSGLSSKIILFVVVVLLSIGLVYQFGLSPTSLLSSATLYGFLGIIIALITREIMPCYEKTIMLIGSIALACYLVIAGLTLFGIVDPYEFYFAYVLIAALAVWRISQWMAKADHSFIGAMVFLGKYSLLAYMFQVVVSQLMSQQIINIYAISSNIWYAFFCSVAIMTFIMTALLGIVDLLRKYSRQFDSVYCLFIG